MPSIVLTGAEIYHVVGGPEFLRGQPVEVSEELAERLLDVSDDFTGVPFFSAAAAESARQVAKAGKSKDKDKGERAVAI
jgi:hypothetical protein